MSVNYDEGARSGPRRIYSNGNNGVLSVISLLRTSDRPRAGLRRVHLRLPPSRALPA
jgi:hypothetical protein